MLGTNVIWENTLDGGKWSAVVEGVTETSGVLTVFETATEEVIHTQWVGLSYGAIFGPDVEDVDDWQRVVIDVVDHPENRVITG